MSLKEDILEYVKSLRNKIDFFGTRDTLANLFNKVANFLDVAADTISDDVNSQIDEHKQDIYDELEGTFEEKFDEYKAEVADVNVSAEIVEARTTPYNVTYDKLGSRLDDYDIKIAENLANLNESMEELTEYTVTKIGEEIEQIWNAPRNYYLPAGSVGQVLASEMAGQSRQIISPTGVAVTGEFAYGYEQSTYYIFLLGVADQVNKQIYAYLTGSSVVAYACAPAETLLRYKMIDAKVSNISVGDSKLWNTLRYGGIQADGSLSNVAQCTTSLHYTNTWREWGKTAEGFLEPGLIHLSPYLYILGGTDKDGNIRDNVSRIQYNKAEEVLPHMLTPRRNFEVFYADDGETPRIYVLGGETPDGWTTKCECLNLSTLEWEEMPDMPTLRSEGFSGFVNFNRPATARYYYLIGGTDGNTMDVFNHTLGKESWRTLKVPKNIGRKPSLSFYKEADLMVVLTTDGTEIYAYYLEFNKWILHPLKVTTPRTGALVFFNNGKKLIYVIGGKLYNGEYATTVETFSIALPWTRFIGRVRKGERFAITRAILGNRVDKKDSKPLNFADTTAWHEATTDLNLYTAVNDTNAVGVSVLPMSIIEDDPNLWE